MQRYYSCLDPDPPEHGYAGGPDLKVDLLEVVECIWYKLKTGSQWRLLPIKQFFTCEALTRSDQV